VKSEVECVISNTGSARVLEHNVDFVAWFWIFGHKLSMTDGTVYSIMVS